MSLISLSASPEPNKSTTFNKSHLASLNAQRKRKGDEDHDLEAVVVKSAKRKRPKSKESKPDGHYNLDLDRGINLAIAKLDNRLLADYVAKQTKRFFPDLSPVELEDMYISETSFHDTTSWERPRTLLDMPSFLKHYSPKTGSMALSSASHKGNPHTLVLTSAGLRAADITRALRIFQTKTAVVAKLFAKHIKLSEAIDYVKKTRMSIGVGTPSRIVDLLDSGALSAASLELVVVDCSHVDQKRRGIFDIRETQRPLMMLLNRSELRIRGGNDSKKVRLLVY